MDSSEEVGGVFSLLSKNDAFFEANFNDFKVVEPDKKGLLVGCLSRYVYSPAVLRKIRLPMWIYFGCLQ